MHCVARKTVAAYTGNLNCICIGIDLQEIPLKTGLMQIVMKETIDSYLCILFDSIKFDYKLQLPLSEQRYAFMQVSKNTLI